MKENPYTKLRARSGDKNLAGHGKKVVVAMSGGVDSSVSAALLKEQGYEVIGIALQTTNYSKYRNDDSGGTCCSIKDMDDARRVAEVLDIPFYVLDTEKTFDSHVVDYFINDYLQGRTPNPCIMCNHKVKFNHFYRKAMDLGADFIATGHYARVSKEPKIGYCLWKGRDEAKDQSYFLFNLTQRQLEKTIFPVGGLNKPEVRKIALEFNLPVAEKPDSQEICFVPANDYASFIEARVPASQRRQGYFVTTDNKVLGSHEGIYRYTIGQRKGLGIALEMAAAMAVENASELYVVRIDPISHQIVLGTDADIYKWGLLVERINWVVAPDLRKPKEFQVKIRYRAEAVPAIVRILGDGKAEVRFFGPQRAITPGQACVFYEGSMCIGGGWISEALYITDDNRPKRIEEYTVLE